MRLSESRSTEALLARLVGLVEDELTGTAASRLWRATYSTFPDSIKDVMAKACKRRGRSWKQLDEALQLIRREADSYVQEELADEGLPQLSDATLILRAADFDGVDSDTTYQEWCAHGDALEEAIFVLSHNRAKRPFRKASEQIGICELCWRSAIASRRGRFFCRTHVPSSQSWSYKTALSLKTWRPPRRDNAVQPIFLYRRMRELRRDIRSLTTTDETTLFCPNSPRSSRLWYLLPYTQNYLNGIRDMTNIMTIISAMDPLIIEHRQLHQESHEAMARDHRLLILMLLRAEAWLQAAAYRSSHHGGIRKICVTSAAI